MGDNDQHRSFLARENRFPWELWALAAANLAVAAASAGVHPSRPFGFSLGPVFSGGRAAEMVVLGVVAALAPRRPLVGLVSAVVLALARGSVVTWLKRGVVIGIPGLDEGLWTLAVMGTLQGLRVVAGWRLTTEPLQSGRQAGQFRLVELLEWMTTICVCLGCLSYWTLQMRGTGYPVARMAGDYVHYLSELLLIGVPVTLAILAEKPRRRWTIAMLVLWCLAIAVELALADLRLIRWSVWIMLVPYSWVPHLATFLLVLTVNALILRRLGYRWRTG